MEDGSRSGWWVLGAGVVGAVAFPGWHTGIGWLIAGVAVAAAVLVSRRGRGGKALAVGDDGRPGELVDADVSADGAGSAGAASAANPASVAGSTGDACAASSAGPASPAGGADAGAAGSMSAVGSADGFDSVGGGEPGSKAQRSAGVLVIADWPARSGSEANRGDLAWRVAAGIAALVLLAVPAVRAAAWLGVLCVVAAVGVGSYSLAGGRSWVGIGWGSVALPRFVPAGVGAAVRSTATGGSSRTWRVVLAAGVGLVLVSVFGAMFRAADPDFERLVDLWTGDVSAATGVRLAFGFVVVGAVAAGAVFASRVRSEECAYRAGSGRLGTAEWAVPLGMLVALFAVFVWTQLGTLFGGREHVMDPLGPDFADYARDGFRLLSAVTLMTLGIVAALGRFAGRESKRDRALLRGLGGALCGLTLVIVVSALQRMNLYADAYGFSPQRLLGYAFEAWLGLLFVLVIAAGWRLRGGWLPRAVTGVAVLVLISVAAVDPEALMARTHIERLEHGYPLDTTFLDGLSSDAAAEIAKLPPQWRWCSPESESASADPWYRFNLSRYRARSIDHDGRC